MQVIGTLVELICLLAMVRNIGPPTWFVTLSANDLNWPDMIRSLLNAKYAKDNNNEDIINMDVSSLSFEKKLLHDYPVIAARHFSRRLKVFV